MFLYCDVEIAESDFPALENNGVPTDDNGIPTDVVQMSVSDVSEELARDVAPRHVQTANEATDQPGTQEESGSLLMNIDQTSEEMRTAQGCVKLILVRESNVFESMYNPRSQSRLFPSLFPYGRGDFHGILCGCFAIISISYV